MIEAKIYLVLRAVAWLLLAILVQIMIAHETPTDLEPWEFWVSRVVDFIAWAFTVVCIIVAIDNLTLAKRATNATLEQYISER